jgi:GGDEF domain-containing protein
MLAWAARPGPAALLLALAMALSWAPSYVAGGAAYVPPLWFLIPIMFAALRFGKLGALAAGVIGVVVGGPLTPADVQRGAAQPLTDWGVRGGFFIAIGLVIAGITARSRRQTALHRQARAEAERVARLLEADIAKREALELELRRQALHDALTDLPNRAGFAHRIEQALARQRRHGALMAVLFMDLDNFKEINDGLGHRYGDELLVAVSERLRTAVRTEDTIARVGAHEDTVARFGGDEYAILLEDLRHPSDALVVAQRIMDQMRAPFPLGADREFLVSASLGIAIGEPASEADELLRRADIAMYVAKRRGKGCFEVFADEMDRAFLLADVRERSGEADGAVSGRLLGAISRD